ncbi:hypothetical protein H0H81_005386 [Sphagnurus paluster]|uniref:Uncharacterized protein n=1 Tax=Sphagnurus paluster TaxID=117069 RepID=A0A9P7FNM4_9AGAR|nr:hypothetical protein H0H81_005386 [Sphagnurus paluster]
MSRNQTRNACTFWHSSQDARSPSLFPYNISTVCTAWRAVIAIIPKYWTSIVVLTDISQSKSAISSHLEWSKGLPLCVTLTRRNPNFFDDEPATERVRVAAAMSHLLPEIHRFTALEIDVTYTSSLPRILTDIPHPAPRLEQLFLKVAKPGKFTGLFSGRPMMPDPSRFPRLQGLHLNGWNFVDIIRHCPSWFDKIGNGIPLSNTMLTVSNYRRTPDGVHGNGNFPYPLALSALRCFKYIKLDDVEFDVPSDWLNSDNFNLTANRVELSRLSPPLVGALVPLMDADHLVIANSSLRDVIGLSDHCPVLELSDISSSTFAADLCRLLPLWIGVELYIYRCLGFNDNVLRMLGRLQSPSVCRTQVQCLNASEMHVLALSGCTGFSIHMLRRMIRARQKLDDDQDYLRIHIDSGPPIAKKEKKWLERKLFEFVLDGDDDLELCS